MARSEILVNDIILNLMTSACCGMMCTFFLFYFWVVALSKIAKLYNYQVDIAGCMISVIEYSTGSCIQDAIPLGVCVVFIMLE